MSQEKSVRIPCQMQTQKHILFDTVLSRLGHELHILLGSHIMFLKFYLHGYFKLHLYHIGAHPAPYSMGTRRSFPGGKEAGALS
jgi:hypothetical protein